MTETTIGICHLQNIFYINKSYQHLPKREDNLFYFLYSVNATVPLLLNNREVKLRKRQSLLMRDECSLTIREDQFPKEMKMIAARFSVVYQPVPDWVTAKHQETLIETLCLRISPYCTVENTNLIYSLLVQIINERHVNPRHYAQISSSLFTVILYHLNERIRLIHPSAQAYARQAHLAIAENYAQEIDEAALAQSLGISQSYLQKAYKQHYGMTIYDAVHQRRIDKAKSLLAEGKRTVSDIAFDCGFSSRQRFYLIFRQLTGTTPLQYQKEHSRMSAKGHASSAHET